MKQSSKIDFSSDTKLFQHICALKMEEQPKSTSVGHVGNNMMRYNKENGDSCRMEEDDPIFLVPTQTQRLHQSIKEPRVKKSNRESAKDKIERKTYQEMSIIGIFAILGFKIECHRAKLSSQDLQVFYIERISYNNKRIFDSKQELEELCCEIECDYLKSDKKPIVISAEMQLLLCALEEIGFQVKLRMNTRHVKHRIQFPIIKSITFEWPQNSPKEGIINVLEITYENIIYIGKDLFERIFKNKMKTREFTISSNDFEDMMLTSDSLCDLTRSYVEGMQEIKQIHQEQIEQAIIEIENRIWNI